MRSLRYLNTVLTLIAILLTLNLYVGWTTTPGGELLSIASEAHAQESGGIANAGAQRKEMIDLLKQMNASVNEMQKTLTNGSARVRVEGGKTE